MILLFFIPLLIVFNIFLCFFGGTRKHILLIFFSIIQLLYLCYAPLVNYFENNPYVFNRFLSEPSTEKGLLVLFFHIISFSLGYFIISSNKNFTFFKSTGKRNYSSKSILITFLFITFLLYLNAILSDLSLFDIIFNDDKISTLGYQGVTFWISQLADSLIILLILSYIYKTPIKHRLLYYSISLPLFLILGFRYRLILLITGLFFVFVMKNKFTLRKILSLSIIFIGVFYVVMFISTNRIAFYTSNYNNIKYDFTEYRYREIYDNTMGSLVDFALIESLDKNKSKHDYGQTILLYPFIMAIPSKMFPDGVKPYPAPQIKAIDKALNVPRSYGQAATFVGMSYFAFNIYGVIFLSIIFGYILRKLEFKEFNENNLILKIALTLALFQLYTRGYTGQFVLHLLYFIIPIYLLNKINPVKVEK